MAINLITQPTPTTPIGNGQYTQQNLLINAALAQGPEVLTEWENLGTTPSIKQGTYFYHSGNSYSTDSADEAITGTIVTGVNYLRLSLSGSTLVAAWITDLTGYVWNQAYQGLYNGTNLVVRAVCYKIGTSLLRGLSADGPISGTFVLSDGSTVMISGTLLTVGQNIDTGGGAIDTGSGSITSGSISSNAINTNGGSITSGSILSSGNIDTTGGSIDSAGGQVRSGGGDIRSETGAIATSGGNISTSGGGLVMGGGTISMNNGNIIAGTGTISGAVGTFTGTVTGGSITTGSGAIKWKTFSGSFDGSGVASFAHGLTLTSIIGGTFLAGGGDAGAIKDDIVYQITGGTNILLSNAVYAGRTYAGLLFYV